MGVSDAMSENAFQKPPAYYLMFHIDDPIRAGKLYEKAFGAVIASAEFLPDGDPYIMIKIDSFPILLRPNAEGQAHGSCCVRFASPEELQSAYDLLTKDGGQGSLYTDWHWTRLAAQMTDRCGVNWMFCC